MDKNLRFILRMAEGFHDMFALNTIEFLFEQAREVRDIVADYILANARDADEAYLAERLEVSEYKGLPVISVDDSGTTPSGKKVADVLDGIEFGSLDRRALLLFRRFFNLNQIR